ncbi:hypothetical protein Ahy_A04g020748 [Arachis hypogaea]|uniref:Uncharacterized protein n=1 Tax=Arachis hypogaea TaxID=3818 RepID=A0A445DIG7_ARAHY|nr:hypothetical protein Ahy_A04g020748 [Arachis hypogaea]
MFKRQSEYGQDLFIASEITNDIPPIEALEMMEQLSKNGFEKLMKETELDALATMGSDAATVLAIGGYPAITVLAGYATRECHLKCVLED